MFQKGILVGFLSLGFIAFLPTIVSAETCGGQGGVCQPLCDLGTSYQTPSDDCLEECCVPTGASTSNVGAACSGDNIGGAGTCQFSNDCSPSNTDASGSCTGGTICCLTPPAAVVPGAGNVCRGNPSGQAGICRQICNINLERGETDAVNCGSVSCCVSIGTVNTGPGSTTTAAPTTTGPTGGMVTVGVTNPLGFTKVEDLLGKILTYLQGLIVIFSLIMIAIGAFLYIASAGNSGRVETAKKCITAALIGLAIAIAAPAFLRQISDILGWSAATLPAGAGTTLTLIQIANNILSFLLSVVGVIALIMLVVGAFMYLTAAGDEDRIDTGKNIVKYSIIGIAIALGAMVLVRQVANFL